MNNLTEQQASGTLLEKCGALFIGQCQKLQQILQEEQEQPQKQLLEAFDNAESAAKDGLTRTLRSTMLVLELHSEYSGQLFDLLRSELRTALSVEPADRSQLTSLNYREATRLLKEVCLRSKAMSHDVIKSSRELVKAFKHLLRSDEKQRRSGSAISRRVRELALAPIRRRSASRSSRQSAAMDEADVSICKPPPASTVQQSIAGKTFGLISLEKSPRDRSPKKKPDTKVPAPPRRSSSLNSLPPGLQSALQQCHPPHQAESSSTSRFQSTENWVKIAPQIQRHQIIAPSVSQHLQHHQHQPRSAHPPASSPKESVSSEATAQLPSETDASPNSVHENAKSVINKVKPDCQPGDTISDSATRVSELGSARTGLYSSTSANVSELDCTGSAAQVRDPCVAKDTGSQPDAEAASAESANELRQPRQLHAPPIDADEAPRQPQALPTTKRRRHRRNRRALPSIAGGGSGGGFIRKSATLASVGRRVNNCEEPPIRCNRRRGLFSDSSSSGSGSSGGVSGDDESSRALPSGRRPQSEAQNTRYLSSGVMETDV